MSAAWWSLRASSIFTHGQDPEGSRWQAHDGVTTALELEGGTLRVGEWYAAREGAARLNFGATVSHIQARGARMLEAGAPAGPGVYQAATPEQLVEIEARLLEGLRQGALGIGMGLAYTPRARPGRRSGASSRSLPTSDSPFSCM